MLHRMFSQLIAISNDIKTVFKYQPLPALSRLLFVQELGNTSCFLYVFSDHNHYISEAIPIQRMMVLCGVSIKFI